MISVGLQGYEAERKGTRFVAELNTPECSQVVAFFSGLNQNSRQVDVTDLYRANPEQLELLLQRVHKELRYAHQMGREEVQNTIKEALGYEDT